MRIGISLPVRELRDDLGAIRAFAQQAESLGFTHLRIPDQVARRDSGPLHEPLTLLAWLAGQTETIELVPSVVVLPSRQTVLFAKQAADVDLLSGGRLRLGIGVGGHRREYGSLRQDFATRGRRCSEQMRLLRRLWTETEVTFEGEFDRVSKNGIDPLPSQRPIPMWIGGAPTPSAPVLERIGRHADGWFALCEPTEFAALKAEIDRFAGDAGRDPAAIGAESGVGIHGRTEEEWLGIVEARRDTGVTHLCMRTLGGELDAKGHLEALEHVHQVLVENGHLRSAPRAH
ncbi:MAG: TIGR03619 family F420-dependent LLM class oxidoreductase [Proteobacteria bacterium]|nr:TIGR03619 family F420-dependent LLM class oxidoreductase [Pseudomonadota bacterium]